MGFMMGLGIGVLLRTLCWQALIKHAATMA